MEAYRNFSYSQPRQLDNAHVGRPHVGDLSVVAPSDNTHRGTVFDIYTQYFGTPELDEPGLNEWRTRASMRTLPDVYAGMFRGRLPGMADVIITTLREEDNAWLRVLPLQQENRRIKWFRNKLVFDDHLLDNEPHLTVPQLLTETGISRGVTMTRKGKMFELEYDFYKTPEGQMRFYAGIRQIGNATLETFNFAAAVAIRNARVTEPSLTTPHKIISVNDYLRALQQQVDDTFAIHKQGVRALFADAAMRLRTNNASPNTVVLPAGSDRVIATSPEKTDPMFSGVPAKPRFLDSPEAARIIAPDLGNCSVIMSREFRQTKGHASDPFMRRIFIGNFCYEDATVHTAVNRQDGRTYSSDQRYVTLYNQPHRGFTTLYMRDWLKNVPLWNSTFHMTSYGMRFCEGAANVGELISGNGKALIKAQLAALPDPVREEIKNRCLVRVHRDAAANDARVLAERGGARLAARDLIQGARTFFNELKAEDAAAAAARVAASGDAPATRRARRSGPALRSSFVTGRGDEDKDDAAAAARRRRGSDPATRSAFGAGHEEVEFDEEADAVATAAALAAAASSSSSSSSGAGAAGGGFSVPAAAAAAAAAASGGGSTGSMSLFGVGASAMSPVSSRPPSPSMLPTRAAERKRSAPAERLSSPYTSIGQALQALQPLGFTPGVSTWSQFVDAVKAAQNTAFPTEKKWNFQLSNGVNAEHVRMKAALNFTPGTVEHGRRQWDQNELKQLMPARVQDDVQTLWLLAAKYWATNMSGKELRERMDENQLALIEGLMREAMERQPASGAPVTSEELVLEQDPEDAQEFEAETRDHSASFKPHALSERLARVPCVRFLQRHYPAAFRTVYPALADRLQQIANVADPPAASVQFVVFSTLCVADLATRSPRPSTIAAFASSEAGLQALIGMYDIDVGDGKLASLSVRRRAGPVPQLALLGNPAEVTSYVDYDLSECVFNAPVSQLGFLCKLFADNNVYVPLSFIFARPRQEFKAGTVTFMDRNNLGKTYYGHAGWSQQGDAALRKWMGHFVVYHSAHIETPENVVQFPDAYCPLKGYISGRGAKIFEPTVQKLQVLKSTGSLGGADIVVIPVRENITWQPNERPFLDLAGHDPVHVVGQAQIATQEFYPGAAITAEFFGFSNDLVGAASWQELVHMPGGGRLNTVCYQDYQETYNPVTGRETIVRNKGHLGDVYEDCARVWDGIVGTLERAVPVQAHSRWRGM